MADWFELTRRVARSVQTTVGWIFWDPGAVERYRALGLPEDFAPRHRRSDETAGPLYQPASRLR